MLARSILALLLLASPAFGQQCGSVDSIIEKATEFKRPYAYLAKGELLNSLAVVYAEQSGNRIEPDRAMILDINGSIVVGMIHGAEICGFLMVHDPDMAAAIRLAAFRQPV